MKKSKARGSLKARERDLEDLKSEVWWHPYRLQNLNAEKFVQVANKILNGENFLMEFPTIEDFEKSATSKETKK